MRRVSVLSVVLAALLVTSISLAAKTRATASLESLSASGVTGQATFMSMSQGDTKIHATLRGLTPGTDYVAVIYQQSGTCATGGTTTEFVRFKVNPSGNAVLNGKVNLTIEQMGSLSIQKASDNSLLACGAVTSSD